MTEIIRMGGLELTFHQTRETTNGMTDIFDMLLQPNARMPVPHYHESWDETIFGLEGVSHWLVDGAVQEVRAGQSLFIKRGIVHGFRNDTQAAARCLCILTPGALGTSYFRQMADVVAASTPADPVAMKAIMLRHGLVPVPV